MIRTLALLVALSAAPLSTADARHTDDSRVTDYSAYTEGQWGWRVGPFRSAVGLLDSLEVGLNTTLTLLRVSNLYVKWTAWESGPWAVAVRAGFFRLLLDDVPGAPQTAEGEEPFSLTAFPVEVVASYRGAGQSSYHLALLATPLQTAGELPDEVNFDGAGAYNTVMLQGTWEWRLSTLTAVVFQAHLKLAERLAANASTRVRIDDDSFVDIYGTGGGEILGAKGSASVSGYWSWDSVDLRAGLGYGHYTVPAANVFIPAASVFPELALYWRF